MKLTTTFAVSLVLMPLCAFAAAPKVERLFPNGAQRGGTVEVRITGKIDKATKVWCSRDDLKFALDTKKRRLKVTVPENADPGLCLLRFYNAEGATPARAFGIDLLPNVIDKEPNETPDRAQKLNGPSVIDGVLSKSGEVDTFAIAAKRGQTLVASMQANRTLGSPMDGVLQIVSARGFVLEQNDDDRGFDPQVTYDVPRDGVYYVRCFAFPAMPNSSIRLSGASTYHYRLTVTTGPFLDHVSPMVLQPGASTKVRMHGWNLPATSRTMTVSPKEAGTFNVFHPSFGNARRVTVGESTAKPRAAGLPMNVTGHIAKPREVDAYAFNAKKGDRLRFVAEARAIGSPLDPVLRLTDAKGTVVATAETRSSTAIDETLTATIKADGQYRLEMRDLHRRGGWRYFYRLSMARDPLVASATVAGETFTLGPKKALKIPVTITGRARDAKELKVTVDGLPKTVSVKLGKLRRSRRSRVVDVVLTTKAKSPHAGTIRITLAGKDGSQTARATIPGTGLTTRELWLTVTK